jgi:hypothetical protein
MVLAQNWPPNIVRFATAFLISFSSDLIVLVEFHRQIAFFQIIVCAFRIIRKLTKNFLYQIQGEFRAIGAQLCLSRDRCIWVSRMQFAYHACSLRSCQIRSRVIGFHPFPGERYGLSRIFLKFAQFPLT